MTKVRILYKIEKNIIKYFTENEKRNIDGKKRNYKS